VGKKKEREADDKLSKTKENKNFGKNSRITKEKGNGKRIIGFGQNRFNLNVIVDYLSQSDEAAYLRV